MKNFGKYLLGSVLVIAGATCSAITGDFDYFRIALAVVLILGFFSLLAGE